ncbi:MAG: alpha/beta fold hydrolase, partial [Pseudomonadota bacterium]
MKLVMRLIILSGLLIALALGGLRLAAHLRERESRDDLLPSDGRLVATSEGRIFVTERGTIGDPSVLLIHGSVGWSAMWLPTLEALADAGYRAIALDLPPMGYSDVPPDGAYDREAQARRILALMAALEIRPHLVAHSFGAGPASEAVMSAPDRVTSLVIVDGALPLDPGHEAQLPSVLRPLWVREVVVAATVLNPLAGRSLVRLFLHRKEAASDALMDLLWQPATREGATEVLA